MASSAYLNRRRVREKQHERKYRRDSSSDSDCSADLGKECAAAISERYAENLRQQLTCLQSEASYLNSQAERASRMEPTMRKEAEQMKSRLQLLERLVANLNGEIERRGLSEATSKTERLGLMEKYRHETERHNKEIATLEREMRVIQKELELVERQLQRRHLQTEELDDEIGDRQEAHIKSEKKVAELREAFHEQSDVNKKREDELNRKRYELVEHEIQVKRMQEQYLAMLSVGNELTLTELKDKILNARSRMTDAERQIQNDRDMQTRLKDENKKMELANAELVSILEALNNDLEKLQAIQEDTLAQGDTVGTSRNKQDAARDHENRLIGEVAKLKEALILERAQNDELTDEVRKAEETLAELSRTRVELLKEKQEVDAVVGALQDEKRVLTDHISSRHTSIADKDDQVRMLEKRIEVLRKFVDEECRMNMELWSEIERHGDTLRHFGIETRRAFN